MSEMHDSAADSVSTSADSGAAPSAQAGESGPATASGAGQSAPADWTASGPAKDQVADSAVSSQSEADGESNAPEAGEVSEADDEGASTGTGEPGESGPTEAAVGTETPVTDTSPAQSDSQSSQPLPEAAQEPAGATAAGQGDQGDQPGDQAPADGKITEADADPAASVGPDSEVPEEPGGSGPETSSEPSESPGPAESTESGEPVAPAEAESSEPPESRGLTESPETTEPSEPTEPGEPPEPVEPAEASDAGEHGEDLDDAQEVPSETDAEKPDGTGAEQQGEHGLERDGQGKGWDASNVSDHPDRPDPGDINLSDERRGHILDGDANGRGGGHRAGTGRPGKTEFPADWNDDKVASTVEDVARNPDKAEMQDNNRWRVSGNREGVDIDCIVEPNGNIVTAYPRSGGPGVAQNPKASKS